MKAASFFPGQTMSTLYAMAGDDCSLHFDLDALTPRQQADHESNIILTGMLQVAHIGLGKPADHAALFEAYRDGPWPDALAFYRSAFERMGLTPIPQTNWHYHGKYDFYDSIAAGTVPTDSITLYMVSGSNSVLHNDPEALRISRNVNSKVHFTENAPGFGIPVPDTLLCTKADLTSEKVRAFLAAHDNEIMLKTLGLAGARNVTPVSSIEECLDYVAEYDDAMDIILQQKLLPDRYTEMTVDLFVSDTDIRVDNVRQILFADGLWVGNLMGPQVTLPPEHEAAMIKVGEYARAQGYKQPEGVNCGVDYFIADDDLRVTEINARWTGGLFPSTMINRIGATDQDAVAFFDTIDTDRLDDYLAFIDTHLYDQADQLFGFVPIGIEPYEQPIGETEQYFTWQAVVGDFDAFRTAKRAALGTGGLMTAENISLVL